MLRDSLLSMLSTGVRLLTSLILFVILAHAWGPAQFGVFMYPYTVAAILVKVVDYGFTLQIARDVGREPARTGEIVGRALGAKLLLLMPTVAIAIVVSARMPGGAPYAGLLALLLADAIASSFALFLNIPLRALGRFDAEARVTIGANVLFFACTLAAMLAGAGPLMVAAVFLLARLGFLAIAWRGFVAVTGAAPRAQFDREAMRWTLSRGFPFAVHMVVGSLSLESDTLMIQHFIGASAVGLYQAGMRLLFGALLAGDALHNVFFSALARASHVGADLTRLATRMTRQLTAIGMLGFALLVGGGAVIVRVLYAKQFAALGDLMPYFGLLVVVRYAGLSYGAVLTLAERQGVRVAAASGVLALNLALDVVLIPRFGLRGALVASIVSEVLLNVVCAAAAWTDARSTLLDRRAIALLLSTVAVLPLGLATDVDAGVRAAVAGALFVGALLVGITAVEWGAVMGVLTGRVGARAAATASRLVLVVALFAAASASSVAAQAVDSSPAATLVSRRDLIVGAGIAATSVALLPFDVRLTRRLRAPDLQHSATWHRGALIFDAYGAPGAQLAGPSILLAGSLLRSGATADIGIHLSESYATAIMATLVAKGLAGRARPYAVTQQSASSFQLGRGYPHREIYSSFPSGHATGSFAFAASITAEAQYRWPRHAALIGAAAYGGAVLDAVSRVYRDTHWPSDVAAGAFVGTVSGTLVTRYQHAHPNNRLDGLARRLTFAPAPRGGLHVAIASDF